MTSASLNDEPIELDSTPLSADKMHATRRGSLAMALEALHATEGLSTAERKV